MIGVTWSAGDFGGGGPWWGRTGGWRLSGPTAEHSRSWLVFWGCWAWATQSAVCPLLVLIAAGDPWDSASCREGCLEGTPRSFEAHPDLCQSRTILHPRRESVFPGCVVIVIQISRTRLFPRILHHSIINTTFYWSVPSRCLHPVISRDLGWAGEAGSWAHHPLSARTLLNFSVELKFIHLEDNVLLRNEFFCGKDKTDSGVTISGVLAVSPGAWAGSLLQMLYASLPCGGSSARLLTYQDSRRLHAKLLLFLLHPPRRGQFQWLESPKFM